MFAGQALQISDTKKDLVQARTPEQGLSAKALRSLQRRSKQEVLSRSNVCCLWSLGALLDLKLDSLSFDQCTSSFSGDCTCVHEHIFSTFIRRNETVTLGIVEPFNSTRGHLIYLYTHLLGLKNTTSTFARQQVATSIVTA